MAATAAAAVGSLFYPSIHTLKCVHTKHWASNSLKFSPTAHLPASVSHSYATDQLPLATVNGSKWRVLKASADVAQEEAAETGVADESVVEGGVNTKLYFGNLPYNVDSSMLANIVQEHASPEMVEVLYDRNTGRSRGFAFVTMSSIEDCHTVIQNLDRRDFMGRILRVNFSDKPRPKEPLYPETEYKLFIGNLSWSVTSEMLAEAFKECGNVVSARVLYDGETGRSRGYGFICYSTKSEMDAAMESLDGLELDGRGIRISVAEGKKS